MNTSTQIAIIANAIAAFFGALEVGGIIPTSGVLNGVVIAVIGAANALGHTTTPTGGK